MTALSEIGCVPARVISTSALGCGSGRHRFFLFCVVSGLCLHSPALLKVMKFHPISARVDNDGRGVSNNIKIGHRHDNRNCRIDPSGLVIDGVVLHFLRPIAPYICL
jgi:hypothetical protein